MGEPQAWFRYTHDRGSELQGVTRPLTNNVWQDLRHLVNDPTLPGRWIGYISYDIAKLIEPAKLARLSQTHDHWPLVELGYCEDVRLFPASMNQQPDGVEVLPATPLHVSDDATRSLLVGEPTSVFTRQEYLRAVEDVLRYIQAGDVFQVNLAQQFSSRFTGDTRTLFERLCSISPAWYGAYLELCDGRVICSTSPELFLQVTGRHVITRPIKGTRPANVSVEELRGSEKDTAELMMIIDLMRNDLGRVCEYGSVRVTEPRSIETHPTIHHAVGTVEGDLHESMDMIDLLKASLPGGSITGAPKIRAMQIVDELEPVPRGPYCGCIGYLSRDEMCLNIAIRTMQLDTRRNNVCFSVGGGIVADSNPQDEYQETLDKARAMFDALGLTGSSS